MVRTLDDVTVDGRTVGVRVDVNSPLSSSRGLADDARLRAHVDTVAELLDRGARVALLAHQGRPGGDEFAPLAPHAERFDELLDAPVDYADVNYGEPASDAIRALAPGEAVLLENTRFYSEEYMTFEPAAAGDTHLVTELVPALDCYVNDAFAAAHRSQPSLVGFPQHLPSYAGRVMERELDVLGGVEDTGRPRVYVLGGAKVADSIDVAWNVLERGLADEILTAGVVGNVFLVADGVDLGAASRSFLNEEGYTDEIDRARDLLDAYGDAIHFPLDVAVERDGERTEIGINLLPAEDDEAAMDVGHDTVDHYEAILETAETVILNGPAGVFEVSTFQYGTRALYGAATDVATSIVGGGDTAAALRHLGVEGFSHVSTGGGAALAALCDEALPAVEALRAAPVEAEPSTEHGTDAS